MLFITNFYFNEFVDIVILRHLPTSISYSLKYYSKSLYVIGSNRKQGRHFNFFLGGQIFFYFSMLPDY